MKKYLCLLLIAAALPFAVSAQSGQEDEAGPRIILCESYDDAGKPDGTYQAWNVDLEGGYVYAIYRQDEPIEANSLYLQLDKRSGYTGEFVLEKTVAINASPGKNWLMYDCFFKDSGEYKISIIKNGAITASTTTRIYIVEMEDEDVWPEDSAITTFYYENSTVSFCDSVVDNVMIGEAESFALGYNAKKVVTVYIYSDRPFATDKFYIDIYKGATLIDDYEITVEADWDYAFVKQTFTEPGSYAIDIYTADDIFVNTGEVIIY